MTPAVTSLAILGVVLILYATEKIPLGVTSVGACVAMVLFRVADFSVAFSGFVSDVVFLVGGMIVVGTAFMESGASQALGEAILRRAGRSERRILVLTLILAGALSAFLNNSTVTAMFLPLILGMGASSPERIRPAHVLMLVAFAASAGGMMTLVGSTPPLIVQGVLQKAGETTFGFFEFGLVGLPIFALLVVYAMFVGYPLTVKLLAQRQLPVLAAPQPANPHTRDMRRVITSSAIMGLCILLFAAHALPFPAVQKALPPLGVTAMLGAVLTIVTGCIRDVDVYRKMDWNTIFVLAGAMGMAAALDKSGGGRLLADLVLQALGPGVTPFVVLAAITGLSMVLTQISSNTAVTAMMAPIALFLSQQMGVAPQPFLMALATAAAASFATPVATPPNTLVLVAGYKFLDYVIVGGLFNLLCYFVVILLVPLIWPF